MRESDVCLITVARILPNDAVKASRDGVLYAIASRDAAKAREWQAQFEFSRVYEGYAALIDDADIDAVYVPLPNHLHAEWCLRAIGAGKHVLTAPHRRKANSTCRLTDLH